MWGSINHGEFPFLHSYAEAVRVEASIKPIRGRSPECKPLSSNRRKDSVHIRKEGDNIVVRMWHTDIITYYPDETLRVHGYNSMTTRQVLSAILRAGTFSHKGTCYINCHYDPEYTTERGTDPNNVRFGQLPLPDGPDNLFKRDRHMLVNLTPTFPQKRRVNRALANKAREPYKDFIKYGEGILKLRRDAPFTDVEYVDANATGFRYAGDLRASMLSSDPEENFRAVLAVTHAHIIYDWRNSIQWPQIYGHYDPVKEFRRWVNNFVLTDDTGAVYYEEVRDGKPV